MNILFFFCWSKENILYTRVHQLLLFLVENILLFLSKRIVIWIMNLFYYRFKCMLSYIMMCMWKIWSYKLVFWYVVCKLIIINFTLLLFIKRWEYCQAQPHWTIRRWNIGSVVGCVVPAKARVMLPLHWRALCESGYTEQRKPPTLRIGSRCHMAWPNVLNLKMGILQNPMNMSCSYRPCRPSSSKRGYSGYCWGVSLRRFTSNCSTLK